MKRFQISNEVVVNESTRCVTSVINADSAEIAIVIAENQLSNIGFTILNHIGVKECSNDEAAEILDNAYISFTVKPSKGL